MGRNSYWLVVAVCTALAVPVPGWAFYDTKVDDSPCTFINTGTVWGDVELNCPGLSEQAVKNIEKPLREHLLEQTRNLKQKNDHIDLLKEQVARLKQNQERALADNARDQRDNPENPLLLAERQALQVFDLKRAAELREQYYQALKQERQAKIAEMQAEMAREAFVSAERWEDAFNMPKALTLYQEAVDFKVDYQQAWRKIAFLAKKIGNYHLSLQAARKLQQQLDPKTDQWWLAAAYLDEADVLTALGNNAQALEQYLQAHHLLQKLLDADPENVNRQHDLSVSYERVGDMHKAAGHRESALKAYKESLAIRESLVALDPKHTQWQRNLSVSYIKMGDMHKAAGDGAAALKAYEDGLAIAKRLVALDPKQTEWQRDLSVSYNNVGDMHRAAGNNKAALKAYEDGLAIAKRLVALDPKQTEWQRDLFVAQSKVADMQVLKDDLSSALAAYQSVLETNKRLVTLDPKQTEWQSDLSVSYDRVGDMHQAAGDGKAALKAYEESLAIRERLAALNPNNVQWQTDLVISYYNLSQLQPAKQKQLLSAALAILKKLHASNKLDYETQGWIPMLEGTINQQ